MGSDAARVAVGWRIITTSTFFLSLAAAAIAQPPSTDPVQQVRVLLRTPGLLPAERDRALQYRTQTLRDPHDLRRCLELAEWDFEELDAATADVYRRHRQTLAAQLERVVRAELHQDEPARQLTALRFLVDLSAGPRSFFLRGDLGSKLGPDLAELVRQGRSPICEAAAETLGLVNADRTVAIPALEGLLGSRDDSRRRAAARGLDNLAQTTGQLASGGRQPPVPATGKGPDAEALRRKVVGAGAAVALLAGQGLRDPDPDVRRRCLDAFTRAAQLLHRLTADPRWYGTDGPGGDVQDQARARAAELEEFLEAMKAQGPLLLRALDDGDGPTRLQAAKALEQMAAAHRRLTGGADLRAGTDSVTAGAARAAADSQVLQPVSFALAEPPKEAALLEGVQATLPALVARLHDPDVEVRRRALDVLESMGPAAAPAAPALVDALQDPDRFVRWAAARTLGRLGPVEPAAALPALARLLDDPDLDLRRVAANTLEGYGPAAEVALPGLIRALQAGDGRLRMAALKTLKGIGPAARPALPALRAALSDSDSRVREKSADVIRRIEAADR